MLKKKTFWYYCEYKFDLTDLLKMFWNPQACMDHTLRTAVQKKFLLNFFFFANKTRPNLIETNAIINFSKFITLLLRTTFLSPCKTASIDNGDREKLSRYVYR